MKKRILSILLLCCMVLTMMPDGLRGGWRGCRTRIGNGRPV